MIKEKINAYLGQSNATLDEALRYEVEKMAGVAFKRQFMTDREDKPGVLRLSGAGKCARQLAYQFHGYEKKGKETDSRAKLVFWSGDLVEMTIVSLAQLAGCVVMGTGLKQITLEIQVGETVIKGHPDGFLVEYGDIYLLEVKSMSSYAFERFEKGEISDEYLAQINLYMGASGRKKCVIIAFNKDSGVIEEMVVDFSQVLHDKAIENLKTVLASKADKLPPQPTWAAPDKKGIYSWKCLYCAYWGHCHPNAEKVLVGNSYKLKEKPAEEIQRDFERITHNQHEYKEAV